MISVEGDKMDGNNQINLNVVHTANPQVGNQNEVNNIDVFNELKRRLDITRRARIKASTRLREKHEFYELTSYVYSLAVLILSVWVIGISVDSSDSTTKMLLIASLSLTFFTMFLGIKNYKERASNIESNYQQLNVLLNKMQRLEADPERITQSVLKELHRDYEKLIVGNENHLPIDFMMCSSDNEAKFKDEIKSYKRWYRAKKVLLYIPLVFLFAFVIIQHLNNTASQ